jgi:signal transduction histidine kinase
LVGEFRTPLTAIRGFADVLLLDNFSGSLTDKQREFVTEIKKVADQMNSRIVEMLDEMRETIKPIEFDS